MAIRVAINGFGRIGRAFYKLARMREELEIVAINDLAPLETLAYLLRYDTVYGMTDYDIVAEAGKFIIDGKEIISLSEKDPTALPWKDLNIDVVVESTGVFTEYDKAQAHITAGAKRVVISAPVKGDPVPGVTGATVLMGVNEGELQPNVITSNASCTTNAGSPVIAILHEKIGVEKAMLNTVHGYTASQSLVDGPSKKLRRGRAAAQNIVPSSTGAAVATTKAISELAGKFDGIALRVPVPVGSIADITFIAKRATTVEEVNQILTAASQEERWSNIFTVTDEPIVSSDIIGSIYASIADLDMTRVVDGNLVKVLAWYDNEMGYSNTLVTHVIKAGMFSQTVS